MRTVDPDKINAALELERLILPPRPQVRRIVWQEYVDSIGDDALRVWVVLDDETLPRDRTWKRLKPIEDAIRNSLLQIGEQRFPYIDYPTQAELRRERRAQ